MTTTTMETNARPAGAVCILDDDEQVLGYLKSVVTQMNLEVHAFQNPADMLRDQSASPLCLIVDWQLKGTDGLEVIKECQTRWPQTPMILISGQATIPVAVTAMKQGVVGVLEKPVSPQDLRREVLQAIEGATQRQNDTARESEARKRIESLSENERTVLDKLVQGTANKKIASDMDLSMRTIEKYRAAVFEKLGVTSAAEATQLWVLAKSLEKN